MDCGILEVVGRWLSKMDRDDEVEHGGIVTRGVRVDEDHMIGVGSNTN